MKKTSKLKKYTVSVRVDLETTVDISAESLEDAVVKARELNMHDVVSFDGDYCDGCLKIHGVWEDL